LFQEIALQEGVLPCAIVAGYYFYLPTQVLGPLALTTFPLPSNTMHPNQVAMAQKSWIDFLAASIKVLQIMELSLFS
jgi:hypothetical protein